MSRIEYSLNKEIKSKKKFGKKKLKSQNLFQNFFRVSDFSREI